MVLDFNVVPFTTWSEELKGETIIFFGSWVFKKDNLKISNNDNGIRKTIYFFKCRFIKLTKLAAYYIIFVRLHILCASYIYLEKQCEKSIHTINFHKEKKGNDKSRQPPNVDFFS